jgi:hypothetical protein
MYDAIFARTFIATLSVFLIAYQFSSSFNSSCTEGGLLGFYNEGGGGGGGGAYIQGLIDIVVRFTILYACIHLFIYTWVQCHTLGVMNRSTIAFSIS